MGEYSLFGPGIITTGIITTAKLVCVFVWECAYVCFFKTLSNNDMDKIISMQTFNHIYNFIYIYI